MICISTRFVWRDCSICSANVYDVCFKSNKWPDINITWDKVQELLESN